MPRKVPEPLSSDFFNRDTLAVARELVGCRIVRLLPDGGALVLPITETEAYDGFEDRASHAHRGRTPRNEVMFGPPGHIYLYLCYGIHWLLNITTREEGYPAAVLIRGVGDVSGPGRTTRALDLNGELNLRPLSRKTGLWVSGRPEGHTPAIEGLPRVGVDYAGPEWSRVPWRFRSIPDSS